MLAGGGDPPARLASDLHGEAPFTSSSSAGVTLDELMRLTTRTCAIAQRLQRMGDHEQAHGAGLVMAAELTYLEHCVDALIDLVQLRVIRERTKDLPHRAPTRPRRALPLSTEVSHRLDVEHVPMDAARQ